MRVECKGRCCRRWWWFGESRAKGMGARGGVADRETGRAVSTGTTETVAVGGGSESVGVTRGGMGEAGVGRARLHLINLNPN